MTPEPFPKLYTAKIGSGVFFELRAPEPFFMLILLLNKYEIFFLNALFAVITDHAVKHNAPWSTLQGE